MPTEDEITAALAGVDQYMTECRLFKDALLATTRAYRATTGDRDALTFARMVKAATDTHPGIDLRTTGVLTLLLIDATRWEDERANAQPHL